MARATPPTSGILHATHAYGDLQQPQPGVVSIDLTISTDCALRFHALCHEDMEIDRG